METLSPMNRAKSVPVQIKVEAYLLDHRFAGKAVFPAAEAMQLLAATAAARAGFAGAGRIGNARFDKFLGIPDRGAPVDARVDLAVAPGGEIRARLKTRTLSPSGSMHRVKTHASLTLSRSPGAGPALPAGFRSRVASDNFIIPSETVYRELVPFGPAYRNICGPLQVSPAGAAARIRAPRLPAPETPLGSPFPLDAAFHAACVWGQRYAGVVAFPVAITDRWIHTPTRSGGEYRCFARPVAAGPGPLVFDIWILDGAMGLCETISGIAMQDVSGGRWKPPAWIVA